MNKFFAKKSLMISVAMLGASLSMWGQEFTQGNLKYTVNADNLSVSVSAADKNSTDAVVIPSMVTNGGTSYEVTTIKESGFDHCKFVSIVVPKTVTEVQPYGFQYSENTQSITFESGSKLKYVAHHAFKGCNQIVEFELPEGVTEVGDWSMERMSSMVSLTLPSTLKKMGDGSLGWCSSLSAITMKGNVPPTGPTGVFRDMAFDMCTLFVPEGAVGNYSTDPIWGQFTNIKVGSYESFTVGDYSYGVTDNGVVSALKYHGNATEINIPDKVTYNGKQYTVATIGGSLFYKSEITSVNIPSTIKIIGASAFEECKSLKSITIPDGVERIEAHAFLNSSITTFILPNSVKTLGNKVFPNTTEVLEFSNSLTVIPDETCVWSKITSIVIPEGVTTIKTEAFVCSNKLTSVTLPSTLTTLERKTFGESTSISRVVCGAKIAPTGGSDNTFATSVYNKATLYVPVGSTQSYRNTAPWSQFVNIEEFAYSSDNEFNEGNLRYSVINGSSVKVIGVVGTPDAVTIPNAVKYNAAFRNVIEIADNAFVGSSIKSVEIGQSVAKIGQNAFGGLTLESVKSFPMTAPECPDNAFTAATYNNATLFVGGQCKPTYETAPGWKNFKTIVEEIESGNKITVGNYVYTILEDECVAIGFTEEALKDKTITEIIIPEEVTIEGVTYTVTAIAPKGFYELQCPGITDDGKYHLVGCTGTVRMVLPETIEEIGAEAFKDAHISTMNIPQSLTTLGVGCFNGCLMTNDIVIPGGVVEIPKDAFAWLWNVNKVTLSEGLETIGETAFNFSHIREINIPASVSYVGSLAFGYNQLSKVEVADLESFLNLIFDDCWANPLNTGAGLYYKGKPVTEINFGDYFITETGEYQLYGCGSLEKVIFPRNFTKIGYESFLNANNLRVVECMNEDGIATQYTGNPFSSQTTSFGTLYVPVGCKAKYVEDQLNRAWSAFVNVVEKDFGGVDEIEADGADITVNGGDILNPMAYTVEVYDVAGALIYSGNDTVIKTSAKGVVIVKYDNKVVKLAL